MKSFSLLLGLGLVLGWAPAARAQVFIPNESLVTRQSDLQDPEYSQTRGQITWTDSAGSLWLANVDPVTGLFRPANGKGVQIDADAMTTADLKVVGNGPEWVTTAITDQIVYTKFLAGQPHTMQNARLAVAVQQPGGGWTWLEGHWA